MTDRFRKGLRRLAPEDNERISTLLQELQGEVTQEPEAAIPKLFMEAIVEEVELGGKVHRVHRLRVGNYRLFYALMSEQELLVFLDVRHRRGAYD